MANAPTGTVTLLFTDIEGSTRLWEDHPEAMDLALQRHDTLVRAAIEDGGGHVFKTVGDAFCAAFGDPSDALVAAVAAQRALNAEPWPSLPGLRVRMALHTGVCQERGGDYFGPVVNRVARLEATAHGGQIVLSGATAGLLRDGPPGGVVLTDLGRHHLKDLGAPERVYQAEAEGLGSSFPSLRSLDSPDLRHNLPEQLSSFVGRTAELAALRAELKGSRIVTLTGAGGSGKTRLALQVAAEDVDTWGDGVWLVELAPLREPELVVSAVADALGVREEQGRTLGDTLLDRLADADQLLVLDNCEHVRDACATLTDRIARTCPGVRVLATSREPLGIAGERTFRVPSLSLPASDGADEPFASAARSEAVTLFVERAGSHRPGFELDEDNAASVVSLCRRLDGIPLALELAAARMRSLSAAEIDERLDDRLNLLTGGSRAALPRQQTLRALIDWSYDLLTDFERLLLCRASVFAGGFGIDAAELVCRAPEEPSRVVDAVGSLVDKSLIQADLGRHATRYRLLETVRQYAAEHFAAHGPEEVAATRGRHAAFYLALAEEAAPQLTGADQDRWLARLQVEHDNLEAAMVHLTADAVAGALRLGIALRSYWRLRWNWSVGVALLESALEVAADSQPARLRAGALNAAARLHAMCGQIEPAAVLVEEGVALARHLEEPALLANLLAAQSFVQLRRGDLAGALAAGDEGVARARLADDPVTLAYCLDQSGVACMLASDPPTRDRGRRELEEALAYHQGLHDGEGAALCHGNLGIGETMAGDFDRAREHFTQAAAYWEGGEGRPANREDLAWVQTNLAFLSVRLADRREAARSVRRSLAVGSANEGLVPYQLLGAALVAGAAGDPARAALLHGAADAALARIEEVWEPLEADLREEDRRRLAGALGEGFTAACRTGAVLGVPEALALAARVCHEVAHDEPEGLSDPLALSGREREVLVLVARGKRDRDIATDLFISVGTVRSHLDHIRTKTGLRRRAELTRYALDQGFLSGPPP